MSDLCKVQTAGAIYTPSISQSYAAAVMQPQQKYRNGNLPGGIQLSDLNFLSPASRLFHISHALYSAGQAMGKNGPCMVTERDCKKTTIIGDSGGYQLINGVMAFEGDTTRRSVLEWLEANCEIAMTLDVPTAAIDNQKSEFGSFQACLDTTLENLTYFKNHRTGETRFLNVLQGRDRAEAKQWYNAVKEFEFEGWAFAGDTKVDFVSVLRRLIWMRDDQRLKNEDWLHFLGIGSLRAACLFDTLQSELRKNVNSAITVSFDTSSPFYTAGSKKSGYAFPSFRKDAFAMGSVKMPTDRANVGSSLSFPFPSTIGKLLTTGDLCINDEVVQNCTWDNLSWLLVANHNLECFFNALTSARKIYALNTVDAENYCPVELLRTKEAIQDVLRSETPMDQIKKSYRELEYLLRFSSTNGNISAVAGDEDPDSPR